MRSSSAYTYFIVIFYPRLALGPTFLFYLVAIGHPWPDLLHPVLTTCTRNRCGSIRRLFFLHAKLEFLSFLPSTHSYMNERFSSFFDQAMISASV